MRTIVVGLGVQGKKRSKVAGDDLVFTVDPIDPAADFKSVFDVPTDSYDVALLCVPDEPKIELIEFLIDRQKSVLVEKPLFSKNTDGLALLEKKACKNEVQIYTAYNHRFEPHFMKMAALIKSEKLGQIYSCRMFYGNGTAALVRESDWRDTGAGVLPDLGSHLLDAVNFWFGSNTGTFECISSRCFENASPDHVVIGSFDGPIRFELEMTLLMWRNHFTCDILAEKGTAHIESLCKWGPATLTERTRIYPSGAPIETRSVLTKPGPTWELEYQYFRELVNSAALCDLKRDVWLNATLSRLGLEAAR